MWNKAILRVHIVEYNNKCTCHWTVNNLKSHHHDSTSVTTLTPFFIAHKLYSCVEVAFVHKVFFIFFTLTVTLQLLSLFLIKQHSLVVTTEARGELVQIQHKLNMGMTCLCSERASSTASSWWNKCSLLSLTSHFLWFKFVAAGQSYESNAFTNSSHVCWWDLMRVYWLFASHPEGGSIAASQLQGAGFLFGQKRYRA